MQLTLVSHYGDKSAEICDFIVVLQDALSAHLRSRFHPYELGQVHGTIVGLEGTECGGEIFNQNFQEKRSIRRTIDWSSLLAYVRSPKFPRFKIRVGGFRIHHDYGFTSRGDHPYLRAVSIQGQIAVAMGWPFLSNDSQKFEDFSFPDSLDELRRSFQEYGVLHKWHGADTDVDNDFFFVLGRVDKSNTSNTELAKAQEELRLITAGSKVEFELGADLLSFVSYVDTQLPLTTSKFRSVLDTTFDAESAISEYARTIG